MSHINIQDLSYIGIKIGLGLAIAPAAVTSLIASSKIIFVKIIANLAIRIFSFNAWAVTVHGFHFVKVPLLWKISKITAIVGASITALSLLAALVDSMNDRRSRSRANSKKLERF